jgi:hypothetical protein
MLFRYTLRFTGIYPQRYTWTLLYSHQVGQLEWYTAVVPNHIEYEDSFLTQKYISARYILVVVFKALLNEKIHNKTIRQ